MIELHSECVFWENDAPVKKKAPPKPSREKTITYSILNGHNTSAETGNLKIKFDSLITHDITYVSIIQTAKASGLERFPVPFVMTNCHNSLCAIGGTINEDDHIFGLSTAKKYGGIYVPANQAVIHQYAREMMSGCGRMILGSDSHTRYGALGTLGIGEGGPEIVKQLLEKTYDIPEPEVILVYLTGAPRQGVGPHDVAIALCGATYRNGFAKNKILEFAGPGLKNLPMDFRLGIDVMTTETACLSSIWVTDEEVSKYFAAHGRDGGYRALSPGEGAYYDAMITIDLSAVEPMMALPFHPSEAYTVAEFKENAGDILRTVEKEAEGQFGLKAALDLVSKVHGGRLFADQGIIAGCAGGMYGNIAEAAAILDGGDVGSGYYSLSVYPSSVPVNIELIKSGVQQGLLEAGVLFKPCFCGPCFGAGDVPANNGLSLRHTTRNFPNREGSKPSDGQLSCVILMDARSIAATTRNHGALTAATEIEYKAPQARDYAFDKGVYEKRVYSGFGRADPSAGLRFAPNITEWPQIPPMPQNLLLELAAVIHDPVTTTDELLPSGDASSYRSNSQKLADLTLSRRDPEYATRAKRIQAADLELAAGNVPEKLREVFDRLGLSNSDIKNTRFGSVIFANKPGDGSAREQAASCQRVLGGCANICYEYATKRYRSNCINWGIVPFTIDKNPKFNFQNGDFIYVPGLLEAVLSGKQDISAKVAASGVSEITLHIGELTEEEKQIISEGCLMNYYAAQHSEKPSL